MNPGTFYLYEYKNNQRLKNAGFMKITCRYHSCTIQASARGIPVNRQDTLELFAFFMENNSASAKDIASISCDARSLSARITIPETQFPDHRSLDDIDGFSLPLPNGNVLAATAPNIDFNTQSIRYIQETPEPGQNKNPTEMSPDEDKAVEEDPSFLPAKEEEDSSPLLLEAESMPCCEVSVPATYTENISPEKQEPAEQTPPPLLCHTQKARKISRNDLSVLPRRHWPLANNSFLLHGYYNYNHLLLAEEDGHYWLGVPGIYDMREARAAEMFGFPQFTRSYNEQMDLAKDEYSDYGDFGYWCRFIQ